MRLSIVGASGHGKVVADIAVLNGYDDIVFYDDDPCVKECAGFPVVGKSDQVHNTPVFVAVGNTTIRKKMMELYREREQPVLIHPNAVIAKDVAIGLGTVIMAGVVINPGARIGSGCIINTSASVDHDCVIGDYTHISVGTHLSGSVIIGQETWVGAGAVVNNNLSICPNCIIGAGAVVVRNIEEKGTYVGVPTRKIK